MVVLEEEVEEEGVVVDLGEEEEKGAMHPVKCCLCETSHTTRSQLLYKRCFKMPQTSICHEIERLGSGEGKDVLWLIELMNTLDRNNQKQDLIPRGEGRGLGTRLPTARPEKNRKSSLLFRFGFVTFEDVASAQRALKKHDGCEVEGRQIGLRFAEDRSAGGGGRGGELDRL